MGWPPETFVRRSATAMIITCILNERISIFKFHSLRIAVQDAFLKILNLGAVKVNFGSIVLVGLGNI